MATFRAVGIALVVLAGVSVLAEGPMELGIRYGIAPVDSLGATADLPAVLGYAIQHNPELRTAWLGWQAESERAPQVSRLPDPSFQWVEQIESVETRVGPQLRSFSLTQTIPWFGTLSLRGQVADARAAAVRALADAALDRVVYRVRRAYHDLVHLETALVVAREHRDLVARWEEVARSGYATGRVGYADVVKAQVELGKLDDRLSEMDARRRPAAAELNAALGRPVTEPLPRLAPPPVETARVPDSASLHDRLRRENPELVAIDREAGGFQQAEKLAGKGRLPDLTFGVTYIQTGEARLAGVPDSGKDPWLASVGIRIPLWQGAYAAAEREATYGYLAAESRRSDRARDLEAALERALFDHGDAGRKLDLYGAALLPKARQSLGAVRAAYEAGQATFLELVDSERVLLEFELALADAVRDLAVATAEIEMLVSGPLSAVAVDSQE